jgi:uncharacterized protein (TIGR03086 family)
MIDLHPAALRMIGIVTAVADDRLGAPTPCGESSVGDIVDHIGVFSVRLAAAARKDSEGRTSPPPAPSAGNLEPAWRERIGRDVIGLAEAWNDKAAWNGTTVAGGLELPGEVVGLVALDELIVHAWDVAVATGQSFDAPDHEVEAAIAFVRGFEAPRDGRLFGPIVAVTDEARLLDRLLGLTGRDPEWRPPR